MTKRLKDFSEQNLRAATIILADADRYGGSEALPVLWARQVLESKNLTPKAPGALSWSTHKENAA